jgi:hypothetical protein
MDQKEYTIENQNFNFVVNILPDTQKMFSLPRGVLKTTRKEKDHSEIKLKVTTKKKNTW